MATINEQFYALTLKSKDDFQAIEKLIASVTDCLRSSLTCSKFAEAPSADELRQQLMPAYSLLLSILQPSTLCIEHLRGLSVVMSPTKGRISIRFEAFMEQHEGYVPYRINVRAIDGRVLLERVKVKPMLPEQRGIEQIKLKHL